MKILVEDTDAKMLGIKEGVYDLYYRGVTVHRGSPGSVPMMELDDAKFDMQSHCPEHVLPFRLQCGRHVGERFKRIKVTRGRSVARSAEVIEGDLHEFVVDGNGELVQAPVAGWHSRTEVDDFQLKQARSPETLIRDALDKVVSGLARKMAEDFLQALVKKMPVQTGGPVQGTLPFGNHGGFVQKALKKATEAAKGTADAFDKLADTVKDLPPLCDECRGTGVYNCPIKGEQPCSQGCEKP